MSPLAQYALQGAVFSAALLALVLGLRYLFVRDASGPTTVEQKRESWR